MNLRKLYQWVKKGSRRWTGLTRFERQNIIDFSRGVVRSQSSQLRTIARSVGNDSQRRRLQRFVGGELDMKAWGQAWSAWVVQEFRVRAVTLAVDETKINARIGVMVVGMVYEGRCIPLVWRVYRANDQAAYPAEGQARMIIRLLKVVRAGLGGSQRVRVLADRGIGTSPLLMRGISALGWTFLFRVTKQSKVILSDGQAICFYDQVTQPGQTYRATGSVFKKRGHVPAHVRVLWAAHAREPWALVTNDSTLSGFEYAQRMWIEQAFRDLKSHGWQWQRSSLEVPYRVERLLVLLVVAYAWMLKCGTYLAQHHTLSAPKRLLDGSYVRRLSLFHEGLYAVLANSPGF